MSSTCRVHPSGPLPTDFTGLSMLRHKAISEFLGVAPPASHPPHCPPIAASFPSCPRPDSGSYPRRDGIPSHLGDFWVAAYRGKAALASSEQFHPPGYHFPQLHATMSYALASMVLAIAPPNPDFFKRHASLSIFRRLLRSSGWLSSGGGYFCSAKHHEP